MGVFVLEKVLKGSVVKRVHYNECVPPLLHSCLGIGRPDSKINSFSNGGDDIGCFKQA